MRDTMLERLAKAIQAEWLSRNKGMECNGANERVPSAFFDQLVKLINDYVRELTRTALPMHRQERVVNLNRIRQHKNRPSASFHPKWLIVAWPVHQVGIAGLLKQIRSDNRFC
jgi:hypothetical protein